MWEDVVHQFQHADIDRRQELISALIGVFRPSDYRFTSSRLYPEHFMADFIVLLPAEIVDLIFSYLEPQDLFRLRSVSSLWNAYLSRPDFLVAMNLVMYRSGHQTLEHRARNRCALLNGQPYSFEILKHKPGDDTHDTRMYYADGHSLSHVYGAPELYIKNLYNRQSEWTVVLGDDLESFDIVKLSPLYLLAVTRLGVLYCWDVSTLERLAKVKLSSQPFSIETTPETVVMFCLGGAYLLYHFPTRQLSHVPLPESVESDPWSVMSQYGHVEQSGHLYTLTASGILTTMKVHATSLEYIRTQDLSTLRHDSFLTDADHAAGEQVTRNIVLVWEHGALYYPDLVKNAATDVYQLHQGAIRYDYTIHNPTLKPSELTFFPELHRAYDMICEHDRGMPLGLYLIHQDSWKPVITTVEEEDRWALAFEDKHCLWTGDSNFLLCGHANHQFTRIWRFYKEETE